MQKERDNHECASAPLMHIWECAGVTVRVSAVHLQVQVLCVFVFAHVSVHYCI